MAALNEHISVLEAILSDLSDGSDTNFTYILSVNECQQCNNEKHFKTNKTTNKFLGHATKDCSFFIAKNDSALTGTKSLVKDRSQKSGSIKNAPEVNTQP